MPPYPPSPTDTPRLAQLRGGAVQQKYSARKITALTANPGCSRRTVLDAAGIDKELLARRLGHPAPFGQSPFAITRGIAFEEQLKANGYAQLFALLRSELTAPVEHAAVQDLNLVAGQAGLGLRASETRHVLRRIAEERDTRLILDHPVLSLDVAGTTAYLEPDALTQRIGGQIFLVEIKSFSAIDGQADPGKVAEAAKQAAVYVLALRRLLEEIGADPKLAADRFLLVMPKDFSNRPYGRLVDLRQQLDAVQYQLSRLARAEELAEMLPAGATLDLSLNPVTEEANATDGQLRSTVETMEALYGPRCLDMCELARHCRDEALRQESPARLGSVVRDSVPGLDSVRTALRLANGAIPPSTDQEEIADLLRTAQRLRALRLESPRAAAS
ncbi:hypothetical protein ACEZDB_28060 [Streptacidiphilus sp. N1-3]|uniref:Secreted protein n=1 Tax=Streptacidiphilus alkalitolerans TaxID=3342712 RepID=A0ABV6X875_9ACTN